MDCKRIKEFLITDYMDKEASLAVRKEIETHLKTCTGCRAFGKLLQEKVTEPFRGVEAVKPPEEIWQRIKEAIEEEQADYASSILTRIIDFLRPRALSRRPSLVFSAALTLALFFVLFSQWPFHQQRLVNEYLTEQSDFMLSLNKPVNGELEKEANFGTTIEKYLL